MIMLIELLDSIGSEFVIEFNDKIDVFIGVIFCICIFWCDFTESSLQDLLLEYADASTEIELAYWSGGIGFKFRICIWIPFVDWTIWVHGIHESIICISMYDRPIIRHLCCFEIVNMFYKLYYIMCITELIDLTSVK